MLQVANELQFVAANQLGRLEINNRNNTCMYEAAELQVSYHVGYGSKNTGCPRRLANSSQWQRGVCSIQVKTLMPHRLLSECTYGTGTLDMCASVCVCVLLRPQVALGNPAKCLVYYNEHIMKSDGKWIFNFYQQLRRLQNVRYFLHFFCFFFFLIELCAANAGDAARPRLAIPFNNDYSTFCSCWPRGAGTIAQQKQQQHQQQQQQHALGTKNWKWTCDFHFCWPLVYFFLILLSLFIVFMSTLFSLIHLGCAVVAEGQQQQLQKTHQYLSACLASAPAEWRGLICMILQFLWISCKWKSKWVSFLIGA